MKLKEEGGGEEEERLVDGSGGWGPSGAVFRECTVRLALCEREDYVRF